MSNNLETSGLSCDDVRTIVNKAFGPKTRIIDYNFQSYSNHTIGYLGSYKNLKVVIQRQNVSERKVHKFFAKTLPQNSLLQRTVVTNCKFFNQEAIFYNQLLPQLLESCNGESWTPECYLANEDIIILEDVRLKGFKMIGNRILDVEHLKSVTKSLAGLHAASILTEKKLGKPFKTLYPNAFIEQIFKNEVVYSLLVDFVEKIARKHNRCYELAAPFLKKVFYQLENPKGKLKAILHTDTWSNNFMFNTDKPVKCLLIDFQIVRYGNRLWDICQLLHLCSTQEIRKKIEIDIVQTYHEEFNKLIRRHDTSLELPSLSDTLNEYEDARLIALFTRVFYIPFLALQIDVHLRSADNPDTVYKNYIFRQNNDAVLDLVERDEEYGCKVTEVILEAIDYCESLAKIT